MVEQVLYLNYKQNKTKQSKMENKLTIKDLEFIQSLLGHQMNINFMSDGNLDSNSYRRLKELQIRVTNNLLELEDQIDGTN